MQPINQRRIFLPEKNATQLKSGIAPFFIILSGILLSCNILAQETIDSTAIKIRNRITPAHHIIPGTHLYIVGPRGYMPSGIIPGLELSENSYIHIIESKESFENQKKNNCNAQKISGKKGRIIDQQEVDLNGYPARYILWQNNQDFMSITLCLGDSSFSVLLEAQFKAFDADVLESIKKSIFSIIYDKLHTVMPFEETFFTMEYNGPMKLSERIPGRYSFYGTGSNSTDDKYAVITFFSINQTNTALEIADGMLQEENKTKQKEFIIRRTSTRLVNGCDALEREIYIPEKGRKTLLYQGVILFPEYAVVIQGRAYEQFGENLEIFRNMLSSIRSK